MRLGEAVPDIPIPSAVDFILPVNCRRSTTAVRAASGTLCDRLPVAIYFWLPRMPQLENTVSLTIVRLGEAVPVVFF